VTPAFAERWLTAQDGLRLYWREYGDALSPGVPVLCLSGLTRNSKDFHDLAVRLSPQRRVICPDYRGRGRSQYDPDWRHYEPRTYLSDLRHLLAAAGVDHCVVVGTSLGGILAMALKVMMPTAIAGVVINDIGPDLAPQGLARILDYIGRDRPQPDWQAAEAHLRSVLGTLSFKNDDGWRKLTENTFRKGEDGLLHFDWDIRIVENLRRGKAGDVPPLWPLFRSLAGIPVLVVRGGRSDVLSAECLAAMHAAKSDLAQVVVPETGHAPALDEDEVAAAIDTLLARADASAGTHPTVGRAAAEAARA
jgi:pimeloyl-ACP methyl ester carboxylesterase